MCRGDNGAQKRTRTSTSVRTLAPEASASTNSAIWARVGEGPYMKDSHRQQEQNSTHKRKSHTAHWQKGQRYHLLSKREM